jgi:hypothetical protein
MKWALALNFLNRSALMLSTSSKRWQRYGLYFESPNFSAKILQKYFIKPFAINKVHAMVRIIFSAPHKIMS